MQKFQVFISLTFILCLVNVSFPQKKSSKEIGAYQWCPFHCESIKLNSDFTFDSLLDGDLFNHIRTKGSWKFIGKDKIYLKTEEKPLNIDVEEKIGNKTDKLVIQIIDQTGAPYSNIEILVNEKKFLTDQNGYCEIPKTEQIQISSDKQHCIYQIINKEAFELLITLKIDSSVYTRNEATFIIKNKEICLEVNNSNDLTCFRKLKKATELKLFPSR